MANLLRAVGRCDRCRKVLLEEIIDEMDEGRFRTRTYAEKHTCKGGRIHERVLRDFTFEPIEGQK